jgi:hypothetical protein
MHLESASARNTDRTITISRTSHIDLAYDATTDPASSLPRRNTPNLHNFAHKFMPRRARKAVVAAQNLNIGIANPRQPHAHQRPPRPQFRQELFFRYELLLVDSESEHGVPINIIAVQRKAS